MAPTRLKAAEALTRNRPTATAKSVALVAKSTVQAARRFLDTVLTDPRMATGGIGDGERSRSPCPHLT
jgi:hypothetical protein